MRPQAILMRDERPGRRVGRAADLGGSTASGPASKAQMAPARGSAPPPTESFEDSRTTTALTRTVAL